MRLKGVMHGDDVSSNDSITHTDRVEELDAKSDFVTDLVTAGYVNGKGMSACIMFGVLHEIYSSEHDGQSFPKQSSVADAQA